MDFQTFLGSCWDGHQEHLEDRAERLTNGVGLAKSPEEGIELAKATFHIIATHLGRYEVAMGLCAQIQRQLGALGKPDTSGEIDLLLAALHTAADQAFEAEARFREALKQNGKNPMSAERESRLRVLWFAWAAEAALGKRNWSEAHRLIAEAASLAARHVSDTSLARLVATSATQVAWAFHEAEELSENEIELMKATSETALLFWRAANDWQEELRAHRLIAQAFARQHRFDEAIAHAQECARLCETHKPSRADRLAAHEALAWAHSAHPDHKEAARTAARDARMLFEDLDDDHKAFFRRDLQNLDASLGTLSV